MSVAPFFRSPPSADHSGPSLRGCRGIKTRCFASHSCERGMNCRENCYIAWTTLSSGVTLSRPRRYEPSRDRKILEFRNVSTTSVWRQPPHLGSDCPFNAIPDKIFGMGSGQDAPSRDGAATLLRPADHEITPFLPDPTKACEPRHIMSERRDVFGVKKMFSAHGLAGCLF